MIEDGEVTRCGYQMQKVRCISYNKFGDLANYDHLRKHFLTLFPFCVYFIEHSTKPRGSGEH